MNSPWVTQMIFLPSPLKVSIKAIPSEKVTQVTQICFCWDTFNIFYFLSLFEFFFQNFANKIELPSLASPCFLKWLK